MFSSLIEPIFFKRKILLYEVILGIIVLLALTYILGTDSKYLLGYFYGIIAALLGTLFTLFNAKYIEKIDAAKITMVEMLGGVIIISLYFILIGDCSVFTTTISLNDFIYLILLGTICTAGIFVWMTEIMRHITPYALIMAINLEPIYSIIIGLIIFNETGLNSLFSISAILLWIVTFTEVL